MATNDQIKALQAYDAGNRAELDLKIERVRVGESYPRNGNVHNPTPKYEWRIVDAKTNTILDRFGLRRLAVAALESPMTSVLE